MPFIQSVWKERNSSSLTCVQENYLLVSRPCKDKLVWDDDFSIFMRNQWNQRGFEDKNILKTPYNAIKIPLWALERGWIYTEGN